MSRASPIRPGPADSGAGNRALVDVRLDLIDDVADWFVGEAERHLALGDLESCLRSAHVAASVWMIQNRRLVSPRLESLIQAAARQLGETPAEERVTFPTSSRPWCLHVLEEALPAGGLTAMAARWIRHDAERGHVAALLAQSAPVPATLHDAIRSSGGWIAKPPEGASFVERARWLRSLARGGASVVVLHAGVSDVVFAVALGVPGGPAVALVNHAAHAYWVGSTVVDLVLNCRGSAAEARWAIDHRGARAAVVPIPLDLPVCPPSSGPIDVMTRHALRDASGVPPSAPVMLTVGATFKFGRTASVDFVAAIEEVLQRVPDAILLAAGVVADERWLAAERRTQGRLRALGPVSQARIRELHAIADVYVDGFPFGTTTALLEAGLSGLPAVLAPHVAPPPYGTDGIAIDAVLARPPTVAAHQAMVIELLLDATLRAQVGERLAESIRAHHTGSGWQSHLRLGLRMLPRRHAPSTAVPVQLVDRGIHQVWTEFIECSGSHHAELFENAFVRARLLGLRPRIDAGVAHALRNARDARRGHGVPLWILRALINGLLPLLPHRQGTQAFRAVGWLWRRLARARGGARLSLRIAPKRSWYDQYRDIEA